MSGALASNLLFVGIANSLNYPNEVRLTALHAKPATVLFVPYSNSSLYGILKERCSNLVHDSAMQLLSRKIAAMSGDVRHLLNVAHSAIKGAAAELNSGDHSLCKQRSGAGAGDVL